MHCSLRGINNLILEVKGLICWTVEPINKLEAQGQEKKNEAIGIVTEKIWYKQVKTRRTLKFDYYFLMRPQ